MKPLAIIAARSANGVIGRDGKLPWHLPEDMVHFRRLTLGRLLIAGRKTCDSLPYRLPLRTTFAVSSGWLVPHCDAVFCSFSAALETARSMAAGLDDMPFVIGGAHLYEQALPVATRIHLTEVDGYHDGDVSFPAFDEREWREVSSTRGTACSFRELERR